MQLWHLLKYAELTEVVRQNDKLSINLLKKVWVGNVDDDDDEKLFKAKFIHETNEHSPKDALQMYAESETAMKRNEAVLNDLPREFYTIEANHKIPDNCKYPFALIQTARNQKQTNTRGLVELLNLKIGANVILTVNTDRQDRLINSQTGNMKHLEYVQHSVRKVYVKFSDE